MQQNKQEKRQNQDVNTEINEKKSVDQSRRKALKKMAVGGAVAGVFALSGKWSKPVVDSIIVPAHAQATNPEPPVVTTTAPPNGNEGAQQ